MEREDWNAWYYQFLRNDREIIETVQADAVANLPVKDFLGALLSRENGDGYVLDLGTSPFFLLTFLKDRK